MLFVIWYYLVYVQFGLYHFYSFSPSLVCLFAFPPTESLSDFSQAGALSTGTCVAITHITSTRATSKFDL